MTDKTLLARKQAYPASSLTPSPIRDISIRPAQKHDIALLFDMLRRLACNQGEQKRFRISETRLAQDGFSEHPMFEALIAERKGDAVGMAIFRETYSTWSGTRGFFISDMFVDEAQRGAGVGYSLVRRVAREAAARGLSRLELNVIHANPARNFYDRMGFSHLDNLLNYRLSDAAFSRLAHDEEET